IFTLCSLILTNFTFAQSLIDDLVIYRGESAPMTMGKTSLVQYPDGLVFIHKETDKKTYSIMVRGNEEHPSMLRYALMYLIQESGTYIAEAHAQMIAEEFYPQIGLDPASKITRLKDCSIINQIEDWYGPGQIEIIK